MQARSDFNLTHLVLLPYICCFSRLAAGFGLDFILNL